MNDDIIAGRAGGRAGAGQLAVIAKKKRGMTRGVLVRWLSYLPTLSIVTAAALGGDFVDSRGPAPGRDSPQLPLWQAAQLKSPEIAAHRVDFPPTRPLDIQRDSNADTSSGFKKIGYVEPFDKQLLPTWPFELRESQSSAIESGGCST